MAVDLGTGDGRYVLERAAGDPGELVIGVDASACAMAEASRRASRARRTNIVFVAGDACLLPVELEGLAVAVTLHFPWGSLLRSAVDADPGIARLVAPVGSLHLLVSASPRDAASGLAQLDPVAIGRAYGEVGFDVACCRAATFDDARAAHSAWGKRLLRSDAGSRRAWLFELTRGDNAHAARRSMSSPG